VNARNGLAIVYAERRDFDRAIPIWGGIALVVTVVGALIGASADFAGDSLAGSAGLLAAGAGGLVLIAVATALLSG